MEIKDITGGCYISADKRVGVSSFLTGSGYLSLVDHLGDPAMTIVPPVEQFVDSTTITPFIPNGATVLTHHGALIVTQTDTRSQTTMNIAGTVSSLSNANWKDGLSGYSYLDTLISVTTNMSYVNRNKAHTFANPNGLFVLGYGIGNNESYYYLAGSAVKDLSAVFFVNGEGYSDVDGKKYHGVSTFHLKAVLEYVNEDPGSVEWYIDGHQRNGVTDKIEWDLTGLSPGSHTIKMCARDLNDVFYCYETTILIYSLKIPVNPPRIRLIK
jgi:hypothetical protein